MYMHVRIYHLRLNGQLVVRVLSLVCDKSSLQLHVNKSSLQVIATETTLRQLAYSDCWLTDGNFAMKNTVYFMTCIFKFYLYFVIPLNRMI